MDETGPKNPLDYVDWERIRTTPKYQKAMLASIEGKVISLIYPSDYYNRREHSAAAEVEFEDFNSVDEYIKAYDAVDNRTPFEKRTDAEMNLWKTIEDARSYCRNKPELVKVVVDTDKMIDEAIARAEKHYLETERLLEHFDNMGKPKGKKN